MPYITYSLYHQGYIKCALHAAKYPHKQVAGVFIGKSTGPNAVRIVDAIPLLHHQTNLRLCMEIGLDLARNHAKSIGLELVGFYQASGDLNNTTLTPAGERVADALRVEFPNVAAFVIANDRISTGEPALIPYYPQGTQWKLVEEGTSIPFGPGSCYYLKNTFSPSRALQLIRNDRLYEKLGDFDDNLEDVSVDWLKNEACNDPSF